MSDITSWDDARSSLQSRLAALNEEIGAYPGPVTGCDAQFNHLLEERVRLNAELTRLDAASREGSRDALKKFMESCPYIAG